MHSKKQSLLIGPDDGFEGSSNLKSRSSTAPKIVTTSSLTQRRSSPTTHAGIRQMNIIKEDKEENTVRKEK
jgi:hypothetical protein